MRFFFGENSRGYELLCLDDPKLTDGVTPLNEDIGLTTPAEVLYAVPVKLYLIMIDLGFGIRRFAFMLTSLTSFFDFS